MAQARRERAEAEERVQQLERDANTTRDSAARNREEAADAPSWGRGRS